MRRDRFNLVANDTGRAVARIVAAHAGERLSASTMTKCDTESLTLRQPSSAGDGVGEPGFLAGPTKWWGCGGFDTVNTCRSLRPIAGGGFR
jgi:hypothetical protein